MKTTSKTYSATLEADGTCVVRGLAAQVICTEYPDSGAKLERRDSLRSEIQHAFFKQADKGDPDSGAVVRWVMR